MLVDHSPNLETLHLFEPSPTAFARLEQRARSWPVQVVCHPLALSNKPGQTVLFEDGFGGESSSVLGQFGRPGPQTPVRCERLDTVLSMFNNHDTIDFLKIDAEGMDALVLEGSESLIAGGQIRAIQFEYNRQWIVAGRTLTGVARWLQSFGYELYLITSEGLQLYNPERWGEFFSYANFLALCPADRPTAALL